MCGIAGLFAKTPAIEATLGLYLAEMLASLSDRGPDSAGFAIYAASTPGMVKLTIRAPDGVDAAALSGAVASHARGSHIVLTLLATAEASARRALLQAGVTIVGAGTRMELYKDVGAPAHVARDFALAQMRGSHGIGHTRMATESAVTTDGAHPYSTEVDQCLVHNGSLSNHNALRRDLRRQGFDFATENDTEVAACYLTSCMQQGRSLADALRDAMQDLDGFYTFVVGTATGFAVLRDPIACKPAVMAETPEWVAFGSEYRALTGLPGIEAARVWEPEPATVYAWDRAA